MISSVGGGSPHISANDSDIKAKFRWRHTGQTAVTTRHSSPKTVLKKLSALTGGDSPSATARYVAFFLPAKTYQLKSAENS